MSDYALRLSEAELMRYQAMAAEARASEGDLWAAAGIGAGARLADIGCGPGALLPAYAEIVAPAGSVVALDGDSDAVAAARALTASLELANVEVVVGSAEETGLEPASFDVAAMRHVLAHNGPSEQRIVSHVAALLKPGGALYLVDINAPAMVLRGLDPELEDLSERYQEFHERRGNDLRTGLRLDLLAEAAGLQVVAYRGWTPVTTLPTGVPAGGPAWAAREAMLAAGVITEDDIDRWQQAIQRTAESGRRQTVFPAVFGMVARKPR